MKSHVLLTFLVSFIAATAAQAQIKVISAFYGVPPPGRSEDVRKQVQRLADSGSPRFRVHVATFGFNPNPVPGLRNLLIVEYSGPDGRKMTGRAQDGDVFEFQVRRPPVPPPVPPAPPRGAAVRFNNGYGRAIYIYERDRWGGWNWKAQLDPGSTYSANAQPGDIWIAADRNGRTLQEVRVTAGMGVVYLR